MRKIAATLIVLITFIPVSMALVLKLSYEFTTAGAVPSPAVVVMGTELKPAGYKWHKQILNGFDYKEFVQSPGSETVDLGVLTDGNLKVVLPENYDKASITVNNSGGGMVYSGLVGDMKDHSFVDNGNYDFQLVLDKNPYSTADYGQLYYKGTFRVAINPEVEVNSNEINQGEVLAIKVYNVRGEDVPEASINSDTIAQKIVFLPDGDTSFVAYIGFNHNFAGGDYVVKVVLGQQNWDINVKVVGDDNDYEKVNINNNPDIPHPNPDSLSSGALNEYNDKIVSLYTGEIENVKYWNGSFLPPVGTSRTGTGYGAFIYENDAFKTRHSGIDMLADAGTSVLAPTKGKVVLAENLRHTGYTVVLEHGGGLKSYLYHMQTIDVEVGEIVERGSVLGQVGQTGDVREPQLHYEVRIGNQSINPTKLFSGSSGLFSYDK